MRDKKSILFITEANESLGFGHFSRSIELFKAFEASGKFNLSFLVDCEKDKLNNFLGQRNIDSSDNIFSVHNFAEEKIIKIIKKNEFSCVIFDLHNEYKTLRNFFSQSSSKTISLDFFYEENIPDISINLFNHFEPRKSKKYKVFSGPNYAIIRDKFKRIRDLRATSKINFNPKKCLILMGGADPRSNSLSAIDVIENSTTFNSNNTKIYVVVGPLFSDELKNKIFQKSEKNSLLKIFNSPKNLEDLFLECDFMFSGGGTTLLEGLSVGMPTIVIPQSNEEYNHARFYHDQKACILLDNIITFDSIKLDIEQLMVLKDNGLKLVDQKGKERILQIVENVLNE